MKCSLLKFQVSRSQGIISEKVIIISLDYIDESEYLIQANRVFCLLLINARLSEQPKSSVISNIVDPFLQIKYNLNYYHQYIIFWFASFACSSIMLFPKYSFSLPLLDQAFREAPTLQ